MARSILDTIQKKNRTEEQAGPAPEQRKLSELIRARRTGKAIDERTGMGTSTRAQMAAHLGQRQLDLGTQRGMVAAEGLDLSLADQAQRIDQAREQGEMKRQQITSALANRESSILNDYEQGLKSLNTQKGIKDLEQLGFILRLNNEKYIHNLQIEGTRKRLDNSLAFKEEIYRATFSDVEELLGAKINATELMAMSDREFEKWKAGVTSKWDLEKRSMEDRITSTKAGFQGAGKAAPEIAEMMKDE